MTRTAFGILAALALTCGTAAAQAARTGPTFSLGAGSGQQLVLTPDAAYDYVHDRYFTVHGHGLIEGVLSASNGGILAVTTPINANRLAWAGEYAQTPRVAFSPDVNGGAGGYLVTWHETMPAGFAQVHGRLVSADGVAIGGDIVISLEAVNVPTSTNWLMGPAVAYSTQSHEFLVTWMGSYGASNDIRCNRLNAAGAVLQASVTPVTTASPDWERDPDVVYNPNADEFFIVYAGFHNAANYAYVAGQRVKAGTGQLLGGAVEYDQNGGSRVATYIPAVVYNSQSQQYLAVWYHATSTFAGFYGIKINADGSAGSALIVESSIYKAYDALGLKYNQVSGDYLVVTHSTGSEDAAISIKPDGTPYDNGFLATSTAGTAGANGNFNPRLATSTRSATYQLVTASGFSFIGTQFIVSGGAPPPPPPTAQPRPIISIDSPVGGLVTQPFDVSGWAADLGASSGSGVDAIHVWAWPANGSPQIFVGSTTPGISRPDVGAILGGARFTNSGYRVTVSNLPAGTYTLTVYLHSTVTNTFNAARSVVVTVNAFSAPSLSVDTPGVGATVPASGFLVGGWAIDRGAASGPGIWAVHVWAFNLNGAPAQFAAAATYGSARPDLGALFGAQFTNSGYNAMIRNLAPGTYDLAVLGLSTVTGTFNVMKIVRVVVR